MVAECADVWKGGAWKQDACGNVWELSALPGFSRCVVCSDRRAGWGSGLPGAPWWPSLPRSRCWPPAPEPSSRPSLVRPSTHSHQQASRSSVCRPDGSPAPPPRPAPPHWAASVSSFVLLLFAVTPLDVVKIRLQAQQSPFYKGQCELFLPSQAVPRCFASPAATRCSLSLALHCTPPPRESVVRPSKCEYPPPPLKPPKPKMTHLFLIFFF